MNPKWILVTREEDTTPVPVIIRTKDILFIDAKGDGSIIFCKDDVDHTVKESISQIQRALGAQRAE